jgi:hypothetical protein
MSPKARTGCIHTVDDLDLSAIHSRAILLPISESAIHSSSLQENKGVVHSVPYSTALLSPASPEDEDSTAQTTRHIHTSSRRLHRSQAIVIHNERLTLGAASGNDVLLEHSKHTHEQRCYINLVHAQLYPDPDHDAVILYNVSSSTFRVSSLAGAHAKRDIGLGQDVGLACGSWQLELGKGLDFQIKVIPRLSTLHNGWLLPIGSPPAKHSGNIVPVVPTRNEDKPISVPRAGSVKNRSQTPEPFFPPCGPPIGQTEETEVFKITRNGVTVAIKVCRKPTVKQSADAWRNEITILKRLNHVSAQV